MSILILNSPLAKIKSGFSLGFIEGCRGAAYDYSGSCVASKGLLKDAGQFGVSVRDVGLGVVGKGRDDVTQGREGLVDVLGLIQDRPLSTSFTDLPQKM